MPKGIPVNRTTANNVSQQGRIAAPFGMSSVEQPDLVDRENAVVNGITAATLKGLADLTVWYAEQLPDTVSEDVRKVLICTVHQMLVDRVAEL